jgi:hypothetical protein
LREAIEAGPTWIVTKASPRLRGIARLIWATTRGAAAAVTTSTEVPREQ